MGGEIDSIVAEILDPDASFICDLKNLNEIFDFPNLNASSPLYSTANQEKIGIL